MSPCPALQLYELLFSEGSPHRHVLVAYLNWKAKKGSTLINKVVPQFPRLHVRYSPTSWMLPAHLCRWQLAHQLILCTCCGDKGDQRAVGN